MPLRDAPPRPRASTASAARLRDAPRTSGITQKSHEKLQPSWILTKARTRSSRALGLDAADRTDVAGDERGASPRSAGATTTTFAGRPANASRRGSRRSR